MTDTNERYFVSFTQGGTGVERQAYDLDHVMLALRSAIRAGMENRAGRVELTEVSEAKVILFSNRSDSVTVVARTVADMAAVYRTLLIVLSDVPDRLWHGAMGREQVMDTMASFARQ